MERSARNILTPINIVVAAVLVALVAASAVAVFAALPAAERGGRVVVHDGDGGVHEMALATDGRLTVETAGGFNTVVVEGGEARIEDADCPNKDCTRQHAISRPGQQLICLPHKLWVEVVSADGEPGAQMDVDAVAAGDASGDALELDTVAR